MFPLEEEEEEKLKEIDLLDKSLVKKRMSKSVRLL